MRDIVERLRDYDKCTVGPQEAADEITRLRAENETLRRDVKTAVMGDSAELADVKRENEKLHREAAIRIDQIEREQEAHLRTISDYNRAAVENEKLRDALSKAAGELQHAYIMGFTERYRDAAISARSAAAAIRETE